MGLDLDESGHFDPVAFGEFMAGLSVGLTLLALFIRYFWKHVVRPLSWLHGVSADNAADGEAIPPLPLQMRQLRHSQAAMATVQEQTAQTLTRLDAGVRAQATVLGDQGELLERIGEQLRAGAARFQAIEEHLAAVDERTKTLEPNGGQSLIDLAATAAERSVSTDDRLSAHLTQGRRREMELWRAMAGSSQRASDREAAMRVVRQLEQEEAAELVHEETEVRRR